MKAKSQSCPPDAPKSDAPKAEVQFRQVELVAAPAGGLQLSFQPDSVFASSTSTLTLTVSVDLNAPPVTMTPSGGIAVSFPITGTALVTTLTGITATPPNAQWTVTGPSAGKFIIRPANNISLPAGTSLQFIFRNLQIVSTTGTPQVPIQVNATSGSGSTNLNVTVQPLVPGVIAWADPPMIGLNAQSTLRWVSNGGTKVRVIGYTSSAVPSGYKDFPVGGVTNTKVNPTVDSGNPPGAHPYQVQLLAEPGDQIQGTVQNVTVYLHAPYISQFGLVQADQTIGPSITIPYGTLVTAQWSSIFVDPNQGVTLSYGSVRQPNAPVSQPPPFDPSSALAPNGNQVVLTLTAPGWNTPPLATATATVNYSPIRILYFKFTNWTVNQGVNQFSGMSWQTDPPTTQAENVGPDGTYPDVNVLSVTGPGGPFTQYLGTGTEPYLQIRYFSPSGPVTAGQPFTLQWFTNAATSLTLTTPDGTTSIASGQIAAGTSAPLTITASTTYLLTATSSNGASVNSYLTVSPS